MLIEKYKPEKIEEMANKLAATELKSLILKNGKVILSGSTGTGKSLSLQIIAKEMKYEIINITGNTIKNCKDMAKQQSIFYKGKIFVIELDDMRSLESIENFTKESNFPVILNADDIYQRKYYSLL